MYYSQIEVESDRQDEETKFIPMLKKYTVFNIEQAEIIPDDYVNHRLSVEQLIHEILDYIAATGAKILPCSARAAPYAGCCS